MGDAFEVLLGAAVRGAARAHGGVLVSERTLDQLRQAVLDGAVDLERLLGEANRLRTRQAEGEYDAARDDFVSAAHAYGGRVLEEAAKPWPEKPLAQGWTFPTDSATKVHWISSEDLPGHRRNEALCGKWLMWTIDPTQVWPTTTHPHCVACERQLAKLVRAGHVKLAGERGNP